MILGILALPRQLPLGQNVTAKGFTPLKTPDTNVTTWYDHEARTTI